MMMMLLLLLMMMLMMMTMMMISQLTSPIPHKSASGLESSITNVATYPTSGIRITIDGFYDKLPVLVAAVASCLANLHITQASPTATTTAPSTRTSSSPATLSGRDGVRFRDIQSFVCQEKI